jgi:hypothetical protein
MIDARYVAKNIAKPSGTKASLSSACPEPAEWSPP